MSLPKLFERFGDEDKCRAYLEALRWPDGPECPKCGGDSISRIQTRKLFECNAESCRHQFSVTAGTVFHDSHLPLSKWFMAIYLIGESKKGISARQLQRTLDVTYKTAWYLAHRIRSAMEDDSPVPLSGIVEVDETYVGGKTRGVKGKGGPGRGTKKAMVLGAVERGGKVRIRVGDRPDKATLHAFINENLSAKHLPAYLDEIAFRFNNRDNPFLFRDTLLRMVAGETLPLKELVHGTS